MAKELPWSKWVWADWANDPDLKRCCKAAKGCWADMLAILDTCVIRGVFCTSAGEPWSDVDIAEAIGGDRAENLSCIAELVAKGVCSRTKQGSIFCRRMLREEEERAANRVYVQRYRDKKKGECKTDVIPDLLSLSSKEVELKESKPHFVLPVWIPEQAWSDYVIMRMRIRKPMTDRAKELAIKELEKLLDQGHEPELVLNQSVMNSWAGVFPLKEGTHGAGGKVVSKQEERRANNRSAITDGFGAHLGAMAGHGGKPLQVRSDGTREPVVGRDTLPLLPGGD